MTSFCDLSSVGKAGARVHALERVQSLERADFCLRGGLGKRGIVEVMVRGVDGRRAE